MPHQMYLWWLWPRWVLAARPTVTLLCVCAIPEYKGISVGFGCGETAPELWASGRSTTAQEQAGEGQGGRRCCASFKACQASLLSQASPAVQRPSEEALAASCGRQSAGARMQWQARCGTFCYCKVVPDLCVCVYCAGRLQRQARAWAT